MKTLIIGGGMAGLTYGILAAQKGEVLICERNSRVGKKISLTGNGKCNIANMNVSAECFNRSKLVSAVLQAVPVQRYLDFLESCGIFTFCDSVGRVYPLSESANSVVDCLRFRYERLGGKLMTDCEISAVKVGQRFAVTLGDKTQLFDEVVLACGSGSGVPAPNLDFVKEWLTPMSPSLAPIKVIAPHKALNGLRAKATATLLQNGKKIACESGEVQFKEYGLSGICIFNLSAYIARSIVEGRSDKFDIVLDLVPTFSEEQLAEILQLRQHDEMFLSILHNKLAEVVIKTSPDQTAQGCAHWAKNFTLRVDKLLDYSMSQVTAGGIDEKYLNNFTLPNGMIAVGEVLNVDGLCGGNNLYFAAASAICAFDE